jgi:hypothetical protein
MVLNATFNNISFIYIVAVSFIGGRNHMTIEENVIKTFTGLINKYLIEQSQ